MPLTNVPCPPHPLTSAVSRSPVAMRLFLCLSYLSFLISVQASVTILPSNNSQDLLGSSYFRIWSSSHLNGQLLAPLTQGLLHLTDRQEKVRLPLEKWPVDTD